MKRINYKFNISDKLALGYGSKYQLLRMLGWHRNFFDNQIKSCANLKGDIDWIDFKFNGPEDKELINFEFINDLDKDWKRLWACGRSGINWDAVGLCNKDTYVLIEAKANIPELFSSGPQGNLESLKKNNDAIRQIFKKYKIKSKIEIWNDKDCYQLANRIVATNFLLERGYKVVLIYLLFVNGFEFNTKDGSNKSVSQIN